MAAYDQPPPYLGPGGYDFRENDHPSKKIGGPPPPSKFFKCICFCACLILVLLIIAVIILAIILHPHQKHIQIDTINASDFRLVNSELFAIWDLTFTFRNPNDQMRLHYEPLHVKVLYKHATLGSGTLDGLAMEPNDEKTLSMKIESNRTHVNSHKRVEDMEWERENNGNVKLDVEMNGEYEFKFVKIIKTINKYNIDVKCNGLEVGIGSNSTSGGLLGGSKECHFK